MRRGAPLPIPNREVKPCRADDTASVWESRSSPTPNRKPDSTLPGFFVTIIPYSIFSFHHNSQPHLQIEIKKPSFAKFLLILPLNLDLMRKVILFMLISLIMSINGFSQDTIRDSIASKPKPYSTLQPVDSTFVTYYNIAFDSIFLNSPRVIDTNTFHASNHEVLERGNTIYSTLSNTGLTHKSMRFGYDSNIGFDLNLPSYSAYIRNEKNMSSYQSVLPYSELRYYFTTGDKEQVLNVKFGRQFIKNLFVSFEFNTEVSPGVFKNSKSLNNYFWINAHYFTKDKRYGLMAYWYRNKLEMKENGGIKNDDDYISHAESDNSAILTNLTDAQNYIKSSGAGFEHYFNLLPQTRQIKAIDKDSTMQHVLDSLIVDTLSVFANDTISNDTIQPQFTTKDRKFTLGRICHSFNYQRNNLFFNESSPNAAFYRPFDTLLLNSNKTTDTTIVQGIKNSLKWNSLGYRSYSDDVPFFVYAGINYGIFKVKTFDYEDLSTKQLANYRQLSVNGGIIVNLFKSSRISGQGEIVTLGYQIGDFSLKGQWRQHIGTAEKNYGTATFDINLKRQSANWFETSYNSNHFRWENDFHAATYLSFDLKYRYKSFGIGVKQTSINDLIYFGLDAKPEQYDGMVSIREAYGSFYYKLWRFEMEGFASLQKASNEDVVHLPLFLARMKLGYSQPIFKHAATIQPSITVQYFTKYYADAYMPALRTFYLQNQVEIGNFPFIDLALSIKVKKADIYVAYNNMFLLTGNYDAFIAPHYPMRGSKVFIGVNWRLFN